MIEQASSAGARLRAYWREELALVALLLAFFVGIVGFSFGSPFDARLFPIVIGGAGILLAIAIAVAQWQRYRTGDDAPDVDDAGAAATPARFATALLAAPVFGLLFWLLGFVVAALAAMLLLPPLMGYRDRKRLLVITLVSVATLAVVAPWLLNVDLPHGVVGDWLIDALALRPS
jgi:hypothetical protein